MEYILEVVSQEPAGVIQSRVGSMGMVGSRADVAVAESKGGAVSGELRLMSLW